MPVDQNPSLNIDKVTVYGAQEGDGLTGVTAGSPIGWKYTVTNTGNVTLENVSVTDDHAGVTPVLDSGLSTGEEDGKLDLGDTWVYTASGTAVAGPYENIGTATGYTPQDVPVTDSDTSSYIGRGDYGLIAPTSTSVGQYIDGTAMSFEDYYAAQGGVIEYSVRNGQIHQTNPGVFFYYTGLSNTIVGADGADAGTSADPMTVLIDQSDDSGLVGPFKMTKNDVKLFKVN